MSAHAYTEDQLVEQPAEHVYESYIGDGGSLSTREPHKRGMELSAVG